MTRSSIHPIDPRSMTRPPEVGLSVRLWLAGILIALAGRVLSFALTDRGAAVKEMLDEDTSGLTHSQAQTALTFTLAVTLTFALLFLGLELLLVFRMRAGRNWARILLTVLAALTAFSISSSFSQGPDAGAVINVVSVLVVVGALYQMYRPAANAYFRQHRD